MNGSTLSLLVCLWCAAVVIKVLSVLGRREPYQFIWWDGGLMLSGKALARTGTWWFGAFALGLGLISGRTLLLWSQL